MKDFVFLIYSSFSNIGLILSSSLIVGDALESFGSYARTGIDIKRSMKSVIIDLLKKLA